MATITGRHSSWHRLTILLQQRQLLELHLDAEIAAGDHHGVRGGDDRIQMAHRLLILDLGDNGGTAVGRFHGGTQFGDVRCIAHERARDEISAAAHGQGDVAAILVGEGRQAQTHAGQIDVAAQASVPGVVTVQTIRSSTTASMRISSVPLSTTSVSPTETSSIRPS